MDIGIDKGSRKDVAAALEQVLADSYALYGKTHGYHWNVEGPRFSTLHAAFEEQYREQWAALDEIAERIRTLGEYAPSGITMGEKAKIKADKNVPNAEQMLSNLVESNEIVVNSARAALKVAEKAGDDATADLMTQRVAIHEKTAWMLRSHLAG